MNKLFCILFLIGTLYQGISQNRSFGTLSMIQSPTVKLKKNTTNKKKKVNDIWTFDDSFFVDSFLK